MWIYRLLCNFVCYFLDKETAVQAAQVTNCYKARLYLNKTDYLTFDVSEMILFGLPPCPGTFKYLAVSHVVADGGIENTDFGDGATIATAEFRFLDTYPDGLGELFRPRIVDGKERNPLIKLTGLSFNDGSVFFECAEEAMDEVTDEFPDLSQYNVTTRSWCE